MIRAVHLLFAAAFLLVADAQKPIPCPDGTSCVHIPPECKDKCAQGVAFALKDGKLHANVAVDSPPEDNEKDGRYVAIGFSHNEKMENTIVVMCSLEGNAEGKVKLMKNPGPRKMPILKPVEVTLATGSGPTATSVKKDGNRMDCSFEMSTSFSVPAGSDAQDGALSFDLTKEDVNIFVVNGPHKDDKPEVHRKAGDDIVITKLKANLAGIEGVGVEHRNAAEKNASPRLRVPFALTISVVILPLLAFV